MNRAKLSPFIHGNDSVKMIHFDLFVGVVPLIIISVVHNGLRVLVMCAISAAVAFVVETLGNFIKGRIKPAPFRVAILGVVSTLLCPITVPIWMPAVGVAFSVLFVRVILVGDFKKLFMSPAIAWLFLLTVWPNEMMTYPEFVVNNKYPLFENIDVFNAGFSISQNLQFSQKPPFRMLDILSGMYPGAMGTTCIAAIFLITIYFLFRRSRFRFL